LQRDTHIGHIDDARRLRWHHRSPTPAFRWDVLKEKLAVGIGLMIVLPIDNETWANGWPFSRST